MAVDERLCAKVRAALTGEGVRAHAEVRMFGGVGFMVNGNFIAGASSRGLLVRVGKGGQARALTRVGARPMVMKERRMDCYVHVDPHALSPRAVKSWMRLALAYVMTLPAKRVKPARRSDTQPGRAR